MTRFECTPPAYNLSFGLIPTKIKNLQQCLNSFLCTWAETPLGPHSNRLRFSRIFLLEKCFFFIYSVAPAELWDSIVCYTCILSHPGSVQPLLNTYWVFRQTRFTVYYFMCTIKYGCMSIWMQYLCFCLHSFQVLSILGLSTLQLKPVPTCRCSPTQ